MSVNLINPLLYSYFESNFNKGELQPKEKDYLELILRQTYYQEVAWLNFDKELRLILDKLNEYPIDTEELKSVLFLFKALICVYLNNEPDSLTYLKEVKLSLFAKAEFFNFIRVYNVIEEYLKISEIQPLKISSNIVLSRDFQDLFDHAEQQNIKCIPFEGLTIEQSQYIDNISELIVNSQMLFIVGHGDNSKDGGILFYYDYERKIELTKEYFQNFKEKPSVVCLMSCALEPYQSIKDCAEYFIIPEMPSQEFSEMFLKGFFLAAKKSNDILFCIKLGVTALLLRSNQPLVFNVFNNGSPIDIYS